MTERGATAAIVTVGDELLLGETVDTNAAWLGRELARRGVPVARRYTVGDDPAAIREALDAALDAADLVIVSGGLGPTPDDVTKEVVAERLGRALRLDEGLLARLEERFRARGYERLPATNRSQAEVPEGALVLANPRGTAPGLVLDAGAATVVLVPGVPREMRAIFEGDLQAVLTERFAGRAAPVHLRVIHTTGVPESVLSELVTEHLPADMGPVAVAFLPDLRGVDLRLTARGVAAQAAVAAFDRVEAALGPVLRQCRFHSESGDLAEAVSDLLLRAGKRLAVAESCTGGLLAERMTARAGASAVFRGGVVAYDNSVKRSLVGVSPVDLEREGAVSEAVVRQLALGIAERLEAEAGLGVTGIAGPDGGTPDKPVGTVWLAAALDGAARTRLVQFVGDRHAIRERAAQEALWLLHGLLVEAVRST